jgi:hypothetical protein
VFVVDSTTTPGTSTLLMGDGYSGTQFFTSEATSRLTPSPESSNDDTFERRKSSSLQAKLEHHQSCQSNAKCRCTGFRPGGLEALNMNTPPGPRERPCKSFDCVGLRYDDESDTHNFPTKKRLQGHSCTQIRYGSKATHAEKNRVGPPRDIEIALEVWQSSWSGYSRYEFSAFAFELRHTLMDKVTKIIDSLREIQTSLPSLQ